MLGGQTTTARSVLSDQALKMPPTPANPATESISSTVPTVAIPSQPSPPKSALVRLLNKLKRSPPGIILFAIFVALPTQLYYRVRMILLKIWWKYVSKPKPVSEEVDLSMVHGTKAGGAEEVTHLTPLHGQSSSTTTALISHSHSHQKHHQQRDHSHLHLTQQQQHHHHHHHRKVHHRRTQFKHIQPHPSIDAISGGMLNTLRWLVDYDEVSQASVRFHLQFASDLQRVIGTYVHRLQLKEVDVKIEGALQGHVRGHWIAERAEDIPTTEGGDDGGHFEDKVLLLYFHGGGYTANNSLSGCDYHASLLKNFNSASNQCMTPLRLVIFSLEYPLAPEHPYPAQLHSALDAHSYICKTYPSLRRIIVGGDSAGGNLSISFLNALQTTNSGLIPSLQVRQPIGCILYSPWLDPASTSHPKDPVTGEPLDPVVFNPDGTQVEIKDFITPSITRVMTDCLIRNTDLTYTDPRIAPYYLEPEDIHIPEGGTLVIYGGAEMMMGSIREFVVKMRKKGEMVKRKVEVDEVPHMCHVFNFVLRPFPITGREASMKSVMKTVGFILRAIDRAGV
ncbi:hypothetical protein HDV05_005174 [Chytridiales sp. JEL 0842]|nr:hypothetical protein HDV05_005174 [Chytridiales sp. JEL 0842]